MDAGSVIALVSAVLAAVVAIWVPWLAFRFALRQEQVRWLQEQRAQLYTDLLTEAYAEQQWLEYEMLADEDRQRSRFVDLRLPPMERARLGTRANIFGSRHINRLFMRIQHEAIWGTWPRGPEGEAERIRTRVAVAGILDDLQKAVRDDLGTDTIPVARAQQPGNRE